MCREFAEYPMLAKYLHTVHFFPRVVRDVSRSRPARQQWIFVQARGGSYSPDTQLAALAGILDQKIKHYGKFWRPTRLLIHYGKAFAYNAPYVGVETQEFADVAALAADAVRRQAAFERI